GLEPPRLSAPDPKSGAATNYATSADFKIGVQIYDIFFTWHGFLPKKQDALPLSSEKANP
ncbi:MAG: hypothetical protein R6U64_08365, partial [Bacteroidales bacterium]